MEIFNNYCKGNHLIKKGKRTQFSIKRQFKLSTSGLICKGKKEKTINFSEIEEVKECAAWIEIFYEKRKLRVHTKSQYFHTTLFDILKSKTVEKIQKSDEELHSSEDINQREIYSQRGITVPKQFVTQIREVYMSEKEGEHHFNYAMKTQPTSHLNEQMEEMEINFPQKNLNQKNIDFESPFFFEEIVKITFMNWNFEFQNSESVISELHEKFQIQSFIHPEIKLAKLEIINLKLIVSGDRSFFSEAFSIIDSTIEEVNNQYFRDNFKNQWKKVYLDLVKSELYLSKAVLFAFKNKKVKFLSHFKSSWNYFIPQTKITWENFNEFRNSSTYQFAFERFNLLRGLFSVLIDYLPKYLKTIFKIFGFNLDVEAGFKGLEENFDRCTFKSKYSACLLSIYKAFLKKNLQDSIFILQKCLEVWSEDVMINWVCAIISWKDKNVNNAIGFCKKAFENSRKGKIESKYLLFELGFFNFSAKKYKTAIAAFTPLCSGLIDDIDPNIYQKFQSSNSEIVPFQDIEHFSERNEIPKDDNDAFGLIKSLKSSFALLIAVSFLGIGDLPNSKIMLSISAYFAYKNKGKKGSMLDTEFFEYPFYLLGRKDCRVMHLECLYFLNELSRLSQDQRLTEIEYLETIARNSENADISQIEQCSCFLILIILAYITNQVREYDWLVEKVNNISQKFPKKYFYLLNHCYFWIGKGYLLREDRINAKGNLKLCLKFGSSIFSVTKQAKNLLK